MPNAKADKFFKAFVYDQVVRVTKALSTPHRLVLMNILAQGSRSVEELAQHSELSIANTSRHLQVLRGANLVKVSQQGTRHVYSVASSTCVDFFDCLIDVAEMQLAELQRALQDIATSPTREGSVGRDELRRLLSEDKAVVLDVRPSEEFDTGHLPGAVSIPLDELEKRLAELPSDREIVAYCRGRLCILADSAVELLRRAGLNARRTDETPNRWRRSAGEAGSGDV